MLSNTRFPNILEVPLVLRNGGFKSVSMNQNVALSSLQQRRVHGPRKRRHVTIFVHGVLQSDFLF
jgi:hypothetical protein